MNTTGHLTGRFRLCCLAAWLMAMLAPAQEVQLLSVSNSPWRYLANGANQGTAWAHPPVPDNSWSNGFGLFGFETTSNVYLPDVFRSFIAPLSQGGPVTAYFRTHFPWPPNPLVGVTLRAKALLDDGAVFYLNGVEVGRLRV